ncbi:hypothetical protein CORC01_07739 [Colletotrichum orchidophilum]|uniref:Uncharacterized protein n=1 Tax=Colletotrichum orchidophilum TaxID=1209926 RepID=A0A1G4B6D0_9PEZI|nr:uncharacterized protein CORC01_07739 [Colletotrichum orchidophilum]OHE96954.1 hypothetical protein CORC01_07739 [Colletotrichum orchidophilum]
MPSQNTPSVTYRGHRQCVGKGSYASHSTVSMCIPSGMDVIAKRRVSPAWLVAATQDSACTGFLPPPSAQSTGSVTAARTVFWLCAATRTASRGSVAASVGMVGLVSAYSVMHARSASASSGGPRRHGKNMNPTPTACLCCNNLSFGLYTGELTLFGWTDLTTRSARGLNRL